jgi:undecaprenyl diphosphate synthase
MAHAPDTRPPERLPRHVVLIPDGNGRWATEHGKPVSEGHLMGARAVEAFLRVCRDWRIEIATVWAFSTENWGRSPLEVDAIMNLIGLYLRRNRPRFRREGIRLHHVGRRDRIRERHPRLAKLVASLEEETLANSPFVLNLALDYGGRDEVVRAMRRLLAEGCAPEELDWERLAGALDTAGQADPDLILRTSGEHRLSGILPLQAAYAELVFYPRLLPEMGEAEFRDAIRLFAERERRFGVRPVERTEEGR